MKNQTTLNVTHENRIDQAQQQAIDAAKAFAKRHAGVYDSEEIMERIFWLFGANFDWIDKVHNAERAIQAFFKTVANPKISTEIQLQMGEVYYQSLIDLLNEIPDLCEAVQIGQFRGEIDAVMYGYKYFDENSKVDPEKWFLDHAEDYKRKLAAFNAERQTM